MKEVITTAESTDRIIRKACVPICLTDPVKVTTAGDTIEVMYTNLTPHDCPIIRLGDGMYMLKSTGEVKEERKSKTREERIQYVYKSVQRFMGIVNANVPQSRQKDAFFITLTYAENMTDTERLYKDFDAFRKRFERAYVKDKEYRYMVACEPQRRGAWHMHMIALWNAGERPTRIENASLAETWGHGFVQIRNLTGDNAGAYVGAYLINTKSKKRARLEMYPAGFHPFRWSRNCLQPTEERTTYAQAKTCHGLGEPQHVSEYEIDMGNGKVIRISKQYYNMTRPSCQDESQKTYAYKHVTLEADTLENFDLERYFNL